jgi:hypothetical protein
VGTRESYWSLSASAAIRGVIEVLRGRIPNEKDCVISSLDCTNVGRI